MANQWFDALVTSVNGNISKITDPTLKTSALAALDTLSAHKEDVTDMTQFAFAEFMQYLANGDVQNAKLSYIKNNASAQDLINGMNQDSDIAIGVELHRKELEKKALKLIEDIGISVAKALIPLALAIL